MPKSISWPFMLNSCVPRKILGVIPARYQSSRFPGKALARLHSKSMLQHVWERASESRYTSHVIVATHDARIFREARVWDRASGLRR